MAYEMEYPKLLPLIGPGDKEIIQRRAKILLNSCYDRLVGESKFQLYEVPASAKGILQ